tara:strand:+ start:113 stop:463 length:351 start_codon:yes stop_codon:yes gene_type:complete
MKERTKKLIIELHQATSLVRSLEIEKMFPKLFKEVEQALIEEANKRGFKKGVIANLTHCGHRNSRAEILNENYRYNGRYLSIDNFIIFEKGKWAEIIKQTITKEEAEKQLGKTILN